MIHDTLTVINEIREMLRKNIIANLIEKKNKKIIVHVSINDGLDTQQAIKNHLWFVAGRVRIRTDLEELWMLQINTN